MKKTGVLLSTMLLVFAVDAMAGDLPDDTTVYYSGSGKRCHIPGCPRLTMDPAGLVKMQKMTLAEAEKKGLPPCSRCPKSKLEQERSLAAAKERLAATEEREESARVEYDPNTKVYCDALWMRVHAEDCPSLILKEKKKTMTLEEADKAGYRIGESGQSGREHCCLQGYKRKYPEKKLTDDTILCGDDRKDRYKHVAGCHRYWPDRTHMRRTLKEWVDDGFVVCPHCIERGPSLATISDEEWNKLPSDTEEFTPPAGWVPKPFSLDKLPSKQELDILAQGAASSSNGIQELQFTDPVATAEHFMIMRFFFPVHQWLHLYQTYRCTGDKRVLDTMLESARHYTKLSKAYPSAVQKKAEDPEGLAFMYTMAAWPRITLQNAKKYPGKASQQEIAEAEDILKTIIMVLKPTCEGGDNLDPAMGIPKPLADDFRTRAFNRAANGIGTIAMAAKALDDLQAIKETKAYQPTIDRYRKCVQEWVTNWKSVGCLYTEADGKTYFYYPYSATDKGKTVDGLKFFGSEDQGHYTHCLQGVYLMYETMPEVGIDDEFMTAIGNAVYYNSGTKNGSVQCPSADKKRPMSRHPFAVPRDRFYLLEAFRDGVIDGQCQKLSESQKKASLTGSRLKILHAQYLKAFRKDRTLIHLGETM
jgi:hypothetical protein